MMNTLILENFDLEPIQLSGNEFHEFYIQEIRENQQVWYDITAQFFDTEGADEETYICREIREILDISIPELFDRLAIETEVNFVCVKDFTQNNPSYYYRTDKTNGEFDLELKKWFEKIQKEYAVDLDNEEIIEL